MYHAKNEKLHSLEKDYRWDFANLESDIKFSVQYFAFPTG